MYLLKKRERNYHIYSHYQLLKAGHFQVSQTHFLAKRSQKVNHSPLSLSQLSILEFSDSNSALADLYGRTKASPFDESL